MTRTGDKHPNIKQPKHTQLASTGAAGISRNPQTYYFMRRKNKALRISRVLGEIRADRHRTQGEPRWKSHDTDPSSPSLPLLRRKPAGRSAVERVGAREEDNRSIKSDLTWPALIVHAASVTYFQTQCPQLPGQMGVLTYQLRQTYFVVPVIT